MKNWIGAVMTACVIFQGSFTELYAQHADRHMLDEHGNKIICYYSTIPNKRYIPPPEAYFSRLKSGQETGAVFNFTIKNAPSDLADSAARMAGEIWGSLIYSPIPINVEISFDNLDEGVLASTGTPWPPYILDENGYLKKSIYIQALAEKFLRMNLNGNKPDMTMTYTNNVSWYFDTDGNTPTSRYDFLSTLLHEMAHGLGFYGYFYVDDNGIGDGLPVPSAFDSFFENSLGERLADTLIFPQPSKKLGDALTSPPVYFNSPIVVRELPEETTPPKMYTPNPWRSGNSLYHLDQIYDFKNGGRDALMTYSTAPGEAIHDPGPIVDYMLQEIGWVHTFIDVDTLKDRENLDQPFTVMARIKGDLGIRESSPKLYYSFNASQSFDSLSMVPSGEADEYQADIPVPGLNTSVRYYVKVLDVYDRVYTMPAEAPGFYYRFRVGPDNTPPTIEHIPIQYVLTSYDSVVVVAQISDNLGLDITQVEYKINDVDQAPFDLEFDTLTDYRGYFVFTEGQMKAGDVIKYRIKAVDGSVSKHTTYNPESGYYEFTAEDIPLYVDSYTNDFESGLGDFLVDRFYHSKPAGFSSWGMHTGHPYPSPNRDGGKDEMVAQLKVPIHLNPGDMFMRFDEIAYIEEGAPGSVYGDDDFYDYVIVEGSTDDGKTWHNFILGWDCRYWKVWYDAFTDPLKQATNLSTAVPDETAMRSHLVNLLAAEEFNDNDIILIRFRLHCDPYFAGWGWAIDNLEIHPLVQALPEYSIIPEGVEVYPNPSTGMVNVGVQLKNEVDEMEFTLFDMVGKEIFRESYRPDGLSFSQYFDLNGLPNGIYLMKVSSGNQSLMKKVILAR
jgi:hypothetical protein